MTAGGVTYYLTHLKLNPHETRAINLRKLRDAQNTDFLKKQIPAGATDGSVEWNRIDNVAVSGRVVVIQKNQGIASSYDCCTCCCPESYTALTVTPGSCAMLPGSFMDLTSTATYQQPCNGPNDYYDVSDSATLTSSNTTVATVDSTYPYRCDAVGTGTCTITSSFEDYEYASNDCPIVCSSSKLITHKGTSGELTYTPVQHNYSLDPLPSPCWISSFFDAVRTAHAHHAEDVIYDNGKGTGGVKPPYGTTVYAMEAGVVVAAPSNYGPAPEGYPACNTAGGTHTGNYVKIKSDSDQYFTIYFHVKPSVVVGQHVNQGFPIGTLDNSGCQSGAHLHVGRKTPNGVPVNFTLPCTNPIPKTNFYDGLVDDYVPDDL